jgi:UDP-2,4-diacetamido-2,4,6-trideoxy-beta-L-altropyranose hydrolase
MNRNLPPLLVRADADPAQGAGHVMRCLALVHEWRSRGGSVRFITARPTPRLRRRIELSGAILTEISRAHPNSSELESTLRFLERDQGEANSRRWVILDGYDFDEDYQRQIRRAGCQLLVVDDNAQWSSYDADIVLNHGIHAPRINYRVGDDTWLLLGTRYALLRSEFVRWRGFKRCTQIRAKNILVTLGGADADNVTLKVIDGLRRLGAFDLEIQVLVGALNPHLEALKRVVAECRNIHLQTDVIDAAPLMAWADIAVAGSGTTAWELAFMQVPTLLLVLAENQRAVAQGIDHFGAARSLGWAEDVSGAEIAGALRELIDAPDRRQCMAVHGADLVDGLGPQRVVFAMAERGRLYSVGDSYLRPASEEDQLLLWQWANDPAVRRNSFNQEMISWEGHTAWFRRKFSSPECRIWIMQIGTLPVGQIRYERLDTNTAQISLSIARGFRGRSLGARLLEASAEWAACELGVCWLQGTVKTDNEASRRAFLKAGFECSEQATPNGAACWVFRRPAHAGSPRGDRVAAH